MISLANDLLRKSQGYVHAIPVKPVAINIQINKKQQRSSGKFFTEEGLPELCINIASKYRTNQKKVREAFNGRTIAEAYDYIKTDQRANNGQIGVYLMPDGSDTTARDLAKYYGTSLSTIQRAFAKFKKCPIKSNEYLCEKLNANLI